MRGCVPKSLCMRDQDGIFVDIHNLIYRIPCRILIFVLWTCIAYLQIGLDLGMELRIWVWIWV